MRPTHKAFLLKCLSILGQFGLDPLRFLKSVRGLPIYWRDWRHFRQDYGGAMRAIPCHHDRLEEGGATKREYLMVGSLRFNLGYMVLVGSLTFRGLILGLLGLVYDNYFKYEASP